MILPLLKAAARRLLRSWGRLGIAPGWYFQVTERFGGALAAGPVPADLVTGARLTLDLSDEVQRKIYYLGLYEPVEAYLTCKLLAPGHVVVDGGANIGQYTLLASHRVGADGHVHAFEPVPATFTLLSTNVEWNLLRNVTVNRSALWHERDEVSLSLDESRSGNIGAYTVSGTGSGVSAPAVPLDDYVQENGLGRLDFIKLDLEGAEFRALEGMCAVLERFRPTLLIEIGGDTLARFGSSPADIWRLLVDGLGYTAWGIGQSAARSGRITAGSFARQMNVFFFPNEVPDVMRNHWDLKTAMRWAARRE